MLGKLFKGRMTAQISENLVFNVRNYPITTTAPLDTYLKLRGHSLLAKSKKLQFLEAITAFGRLTTWAT